MNAEVSITLPRATWVTLHRAAGEQGRDLAADEVNGFRGSSMRGEVDSLYLRLGEILEQSGVNLTATVGDDVYEYLEYVYSSESANAVDAARAAIREARASAH